MSPKSGLTFRGILFFMQNTFGSFLFFAKNRLPRINDGKADLPRRLVEYDMSGLSFREYLDFEADIKIGPSSLEEILSNPAAICSEVRGKCRPLQYFPGYLRTGYYPFYFENKRMYRTLVENAANYVIEGELPAYRGLEVGNVRKVRALLRILSQSVPFQIDIAKISRTIGIERLTTLKYMKYLEEAGLIRRLYTELDSVSDLQKPDKVLLDNSNLIYALSGRDPEIGTVRETFFCNQLSSAGHRVEYGGLKTGDFRLDGGPVVEVGGADKTLRQVRKEEDGYVAADDIESPVFRKIPLWAFGFLY